MRPGFRTGGFGRVGFRPRFGYGYGFGVPFLTGALIGGALASPYYYYGYGYPYPYYY